MAESNQERLSEIQRQAVILHGLCQGVIVLQDDSTSQGSNALYALIDVVEGRSRSLADDLEALEASMSNDPQA